jgi:ABC-type nickel/cobalt efflux system permease component RcnA
MTELPTLLVALVLGLRHATDPDHLTAVSTLVFAEERHGPAKAGRLGFAWGLGHATTLLALGLPIVLLGFHLPERVGQAAEALIGLLIIVLAVRLLWRWWRGRIHLHLHTHDGAPHAHMHVHDHDHAVGGTARHRHAHADALGKTPLAAYGIGLVHGVGGSAAVGLLLVGSMATRGGAAIALLLFASGTAVSMALVSAAFAWALGRGPVLGQLRRILPAFGAASLLFGIWYGGTALGSLLNS